MTSAAVVPAPVEADVSVWRAVAGASVDVPSVNSLVYYFPKGHMEHLSLDDDAVPDGFREFVHRHFFCRVLSMSFYYDSSSGEPFVKFVLRPEKSSEGVPMSYGAVEDGDSDVIASAKILTPSDANNGGGFSVPKACADSVFPPLNFQEDPPVQTLKMKDAYNVVWSFRHIYRGTPRRHLLTTGWASFVNSKRLISGDTIVFMRKKSTEELHVGVRRSRGISHNNLWGLVESPSSNSNSSAPDLWEAIENAHKGMEFEVVYYPRIGSPDFVVRAEKVASGFWTDWRVGMNILMAVEVEDSTRLSWFRGVITAVMQPEDSGLWRMLEVAWREPEPQFKNVNRVNPWDVEYDQHQPTTTQFPSPLPLQKKVRTKENPETPTDGTRTAEFGFTLMAEHVVIPPAGMQGARQSEILIPRLLSHLCDDEIQTRCFRNNSVPEIGIAPNLVSTESVHSDNYSHDNQGISEDHSSQDRHTQSATQVTSTRFKLFGQIILLPKPDEGRSSETNGGKTDSEINGPSNNCNGTNQSSPITNEFTELENSLPDRLGCSSVPAFIGGDNIM